MGLPIDFPQSTAAGGGFRPPTTAPIKPQRPLLNAILMGTQALGNLGTFAGGLADMGNFLSGGQGFQQGLIMQLLNRMRGNGGNGGGPMQGGGGMGVGGGVKPRGGGGAPFGTQEGNYGPFTGAVLRHTPQSVLMNTSGPMYQVARDFYLGPPR